MHLVKLILLTGLLTVAWTASILLQASFLQEPVPIPQTVPDDIYDSFPESEWLLTQATSMEKGPASDTALTTLMAKDSNNVSDPSAPVKCRPYKCRH